MITFTVIAVSYIYTFRRMNPMLPEEILQGLIQKNDNKILLVVYDGLGDIPKKDAKTPLEAANHPNLDRLASDGALGFATPISPGITPGSGPSHMSLFGYDPVKHQIGRGVLEALGVGLEMTPNDVAARANFATMDENGVITDRRAGRIPTEKNKELCKKLTDAIPEVDGAEIIIEPGLEHRFVVIFRGEGLSGNVNDTDPQKEGKKPLEVKAQNFDAEQTALLINKFMAQANEVLDGESPANTLLLRGVAEHPELPTMEEAFGLKAAAIAAYPMYRGLSTLVGMDVLETGKTVADEFDTLKENWDKYDFFYLHVKKTDSYGEDGNFEKKTHVIEEVDPLLETVFDLDPSVVAVTCDHSTPWSLKAHSWHPCPLLLRSENGFNDDTTVFTERECGKGMLGHIMSLDLMQLMLAHALKLDKYGA